MQTYIDSDGNERCDNCDETTTECTCVCVVCEEAVAECDCPEGPAYPAVS